MEVRTSQGTVGTLEEFVSLAKEDFREAYQLFIDTSFKRLLKGREELLPYYASHGKNACAVSESGRISYRRRG